MSPSRSPIAIVAALVVVGVLVGVALFTGTHPGRSKGSRGSPPGVASVPAPGGVPIPAVGAAEPATRAWLCPRCRQQVDPSAAICPYCAWYPGADVGPPAGLGQQPGALAPTEAPGMVQAPGAFGATRAAPGSVGPAGGLPSPRQQDAAQKQLIEGHWLGLEVIPLTPELAKEYGIAADERGVLVDEITLEAAESGILAGDMVHAIAGEPTGDLRQFLAATLKVSRSSAAPVEVSRRGAVLSFTMRARMVPELGFAQMEAAQPIRPGSISPHRSLGEACTSCHIIMNHGGQLPTDMGDILPTAPPITKLAVPPHGNRGPCDSCHTVVP
jgi:hypothetical protein